MKRVTATFKVFEALKKDALTLDQLLKITGEPYNRVTAALFGLKNRYQAIAEDNGVYVATPESDTRIRTVEEIEDNRRTKSRGTRYRRLKIVEESDKAKIKRLMEENEALEEEKRIMFREHTNLWKSYDKLEKETRDIIRKLRNRL